MLNIDKALGIYSDRIAEGENADIIEISKLVANDEREEFIELARFVEMTASLKATEDFNKIFKELNDYKEDYYSYEGTVNFRGKKETTSSRDIVDKIFDEVFGDEE